MTREFIHRLNILTSQWLYLEQELFRDSDEKYHKKEQRKIENLIEEFLTENQGVNTNILKILKK